jgi:hypothetical protein
MLNAFRYSDLPYEDYASACSHKVVRAWSLLSNEVSEIKLYFKSVMQLDYRNFMYQIS